MALSHTRIAFPSPGPSLLHTLQNPSFVTPFPLPGSHFYQTPPFFKAFTIPFLLCPSLSRALTTPRHLPLNGKVSEGELSVTSFAASCSRSSTVPFLSTYNVRSFCRSANRKVFNNYLLRSLVTVSNLSGNTWAGHTTYTHNGWQNCLNEDRTLSSEVRHAST